MLDDSLPDFDESRIVAQEADSSFFFYRTDISIRFRENVTDAAKDAFFRRHEMIVVGLTPLEQFFVRIPDPGPAFRHLMEALERLNAEPEVERATPVPFSQLPGILHTGGFLRSESQEEPAVRSDSPYETWAKQTGRLSGGLQERRYTKD